VTSTLGLFKFVLKNKLSLFWATEGEPREQLYEWKTEQVLMCVFEHRLHCIKLLES
jgi:hypothetical protein